MKIRFVMTLGFLALAGTPAASEMIDDTSWEGPAMLVEDPGRVSEAEIDAYLTALRAQQAAHKRWDEKYAEAWSAAKRAGDEARAGRLMSLGGEAARDAVARTPGIDVERFQKIHEAVLSDQFPDLNERVRTEVRARARSQERSGEMGD